MLTLQAHIDPFVAGERLVATKQWNVPFGRRVTGFRWHAFHCSVEYERMTLVASGMLALPGPVEKCIVDVGYHHATFDPHAPWWPRFVSSLFFQSDRWRNWAVLVGAIASALVFVCMQVFIDDIKRSESVCMSRFIPNVNRPAGP